jgi:GH43 family beta-xylosidase
MQQFIWIFKNLFFRNGSYIRFSTTKKVEIKQNDGTIREIFVMEKDDKNPFTKDYIEISEELHDTDTKYAKKTKEKS